MPTQTKIKAPIRPAIPTGAEIYVMFMKDIELDLMPENIRALDEKYQNETASERKKRGKRYRAAFEKVQQLSDEYLSKLKSNVEQYRKSTMAYVESNIRAEEQIQIDLFESTFTNPVS